MNKIHGNPNKAKKYYIWFLILLLLFTFRVLAQLFQYIFNSNLLPPFESWHSGALPYWLLLIFQFIIIVVLFKTTLNFASGKVIARPKIGIIYLVLGCIYFSIMLFRLIGGVTFAKDISWFNAHIPTFFHLVLATSVLLLGYFHYIKNEKRGIK